MILIVNDYDGLYSKFWAHLGGEVIEDPEVLFRIPGSVKLVCYSGGSDISPSLYGHANLASHCSPERDRQEVLIFEQAVKQGIPQTGICRGSQFLNVMCGGTMTQDLRGSHGGGNHKCLTLDGDSFEVTSSHHQMSVLGEGGELLAWAENSVQAEDCVYDGKLPSSAFDERGRVSITEAFHYPEFRVFACQFHAEWMNIESDAAQWQLQKTREICYEGEPLALSASSFPVVGPAVQMSIVSSKAGGFSEEVIWDANDPQVSERAYAGTGPCAHPLYRSKYPFLCKDDMRVAQDTKPPNNQDITQGGKLSPYCYESEIKRTPMKSGEIACKRR